MDLKLRAGIFGKVCECLSMGTELSDTTSHVCQLCIRLLENAQELVERGLVEHAAGITTNALIQTTLSSFGASSGGIVGTLGQGCVWAFTKSIVDQIRSLGYVPSPKQGCVGFGACSKEEFPE